MSLLKKIEMETDKFDYAVLEWNQDTLSSLAEKMGWKTFDDVLADTNPGWEVVFSLVATLPNIAFLVKRAKSESEEIAEDGTKKVKLPGAELTVAEPVKTKPTLKQVNKLGKGKRTK